MSEAFTREDYKVLAETWSAAAKDLAEQRKELRTWCVGRRLKGSGSSTLW